MTVTPDFVAYHDSNPQLYLAPNLRMCTLTKDILQASHPARHCHVCQPAQPEYVDLSTQGRHLSPRGRSAVTSPKRRVPIRAVGYTLTLGLALVLFNRVNGVQKSMNKCTAALPLTFKGKQPKRRTQARDHAEPDQD
ncbi:hypothetical protein QQF64_006203 [Cirrhinus molitorella]|uniref:Uncharacterized protein n=1 Tax=Cirrhinus molitorella TaxID=172907 RepID=A0ABR3MED7_9TELE